MSAIMKIQTLAKPVNEISTQPKWSQETRLGPEVWAHCSILVNPLSILNLIRVQNLRGQLADLRTQVMRAVHKYL